ncbi:type IV pilin protein [Variovorax saccharolyticus]|uniref:type IV pilin protein n=1 Tax=Variovorax saccharolyticus TaxID=3053516 RepID=UPI0025781B17|nr:type IV pilin protein [Variovorax sp. J22R187]MDM0016755.1 type IV pilin protein [Variovorax sp. J22R187]
MTRRWQPGFTLIELLVVLALVAILAALALPSYQAHVQRALRAEARAGLLQAAHWLERAATATGRYPDDPADFPESLRSVPSGSYRIVFEPADAQGSGYTLTALPLGTQAGDRCGGYTLDHAGVRGLAAAGAADELQAECWNR